MSHLTESKIQETLNQIYFLLTDSLARKDGLIKKNLMGKVVDYSTRGVISAGRINSQTYKDALIPFGHTGVPLSHLCNLFLPFFIYHIRAWFEDLFMTIKEIPGSKGTYFKLVNPMDDYSPDKLKKMISLYIKSPENRYDPLYVNTNAGKKKLLLYKDKLMREFTITDLLFITANEVCKDKHVYLTRYPIET